MPERCRSTRSASAEVHSVWSTARPRHTWQHPIISLITDMVFRMQYGWERKPAACCITKCSSCVACLRLRRIARARKDAGHRSVWRPRQTLPLAGRPTRPPPAPASAGGWRPSAVSASSSPRGSGAAARGGDPWPSASARPSARPAAGASPGAHAPAIGGRRLRALHAPPRVRPRRRPQPRAAGPPARPTVGGARVGGTVATSRCAACPRVAHTSASIVGLCMPCTRTSPRPAENASRHVHAKRIKAKRMDIGKGRRWEEGRRTRDVYRCGDVGRHARARTP